MRAAVLILPTLAAALFLLPAGGDSAPAVASQANRPAALHLPWKEAGLTEREAAAHLLNRFAYGPRPGEVDAVVKMGLDRWFERQLAADLPDRQVDELLRRLPVLRLSADEIAETYPSPGLVFREAQEAGVIPEGIQGKKGADDSERLQVREAVQRWASRQGYHPQRELIGQLMTQKLDRAVLSENQLAEVMTDFWFNHFNVSTTDNKSRPWLLSYERDAIRPHALGRVRDLLEATARHPAMLLYLDNAQSTAAAEATTTLENEIRARAPRRGAGFYAMGRRGGPAAGDEFSKSIAAPRRQPNRRQGLNENYARELMELHTLGVEGGYTQKDVVEVARAFTGWSLIPPRRREQAERRLDRVQRLGGLGFERDGAFLFRADVHDAGTKTVLGKRLPAGRGIEDGEDVLDLLGVHPSTARHLATKLAVRFVSDQPPQALIDRLTAVYQQSGGDTRTLLRTIAEAPEFWSRQTLGAKIKSPFELAASAIRATGGRIESPRTTLQWISRMGQPLYAYQAPTGYPDRAAAWVNTGSLLSRMSFGLQLASGRVDGVDLDLPALHSGREPASREEALRVYAGLLMPGRALDPVLEQLGPMVADPGLAQRIDAAAPGEETAAGSAMAGAMDQDETIDAPPQRPGRKGLKELGGKKGRWDERSEISPPHDLHPPTPLEQVVGVILGSPEFQRR